MVAFQHLSSFFINQWIKRSTVQYFNAMVFKISRTTERVSLFWLYLFLYILFLTKFLSLFFKFLFFNLVAMKDQDILNDDASHCKLARSDPKIASFEFANLQYFNSSISNLQYFNSAESGLVRRDSHSLRSRSHDAPTPTRFARRILFRPRWEPVHRRLEMRNSGFHAVFTSVIVLW